jgi:hypothetical protein
VVGVNGGHRGRHVGGGIDYQIQVVEWSFDRVLIPSGGRSQSLEDDMLDSVGLETFDDFIQSRHEIVSPCLYSHVKRHEEF